MVLGGEDALRGLKVWRESWLPASAEPSPAEPCRCAPCSGFRCLCSPMFLLVLAIVGMSYGPYVLWLPHTTLWSYFCVGVFHVLVFLLVASYTMCVFTDPGSTPAEWSRLVASDSNLASEHRLCSRTSMYRPLRSHFCSVTRRVVLNMCARTDRSRPAFRRKPMLPRAHVTTADRATHPCHAGTTFVHGSSTPWASTIASAWQRMPALLDH